MVIVYVLVYCCVWERTAEKAFVQTTREEETIFVFEKKQLLLFIFTFKLIPRGNLHKEGKSNIDREHVFPRRACANSTQKKAQPS